jgi:hypothetical protein
VTTTKLTPPRHEAFPGQVTLTAAEFNQRCQPGTRVRYWRYGEPQETVTIDKAMKRGGVSRVRVESEDRAIPLDGMAFVRLGHLTADEFNERFPIGTPVRFFPIIDEPAHEVTKTRSEAWTLGHGAVVVKVEGRTGGVILEALEIIEAAQ